MRPSVHRGIVGSLALPVTVELIWILQGFTDMSYPKKLVDTGIVTVKKGHIWEVNVPTEVAKGMLTMETGTYCFAVSAVSNVTSKNRVLDKYLFNK